MTVTHKEALQILKDHGENPQFTIMSLNGKASRDYDESFYGWYGKRNTYTVKQVRNFLGY